MIGVSAILAGVAVPTYVAYVERANIAADTETVADINYAMQLAGRSGDIKTANSGIVGYVLLSEEEDAVAKDTLTDVNGTSLNTTYLDSALTTAFGDDYASTLHVKYDGWTDVQTMLANADGSVVDSTYITAVGTETLLSDVQGCTTALANFLSGLYANSSDAYDELVSLLDDGDSKYFSGLISDSSDLTSTSMANATVLAVAAYVSDHEDSVIKSFTGSNVGTIDGSTVANVYYMPSNMVLNSILGLNSGSDGLIYTAAIWYAAGEALVAYLDDSECTAEFKSIDMINGLDQGSGSERADGIILRMKTAYFAIVNIIQGREDLQAKVQKYYYGDDTPNLSDTDFTVGSASNQTQSYKDGLAFVSMMSTINDLSDDYSDALNTEGLFTSDDVLNRVNSYVAASGLDVTDTALAAVLNDEDGSYILVVVQSDGNGNISCTTVPAAAAP